MDFHIYNIRKSTGGEVAIRWLLFIPLQYICHLIVCPCDVNGLLSIEKKKRTKVKAGMIRTVSDCRQKSSRSSLSMTFVIFLSLSFSARPRPQRASTRSGN